MRLFIDKIWPGYSKLADLSLNTVVKIELDYSPNPTIETIQRIAEALEISVDNLLKK